MHANPTSGIGDAGKQVWYKKSATQKTIFVILAVVPSYIAYLLFGLYPNALGIYYSVLKWDGFNEPEFIGLQNYISLFKDEYVWRALYHNLLLALTIPVSVIILSLLIAYLLSNRNFIENGFYKIVFFFPNVLSAIVVSLLWAFIYDGSNGLLNGVLKLLGIPVGELYWLGDERFALWALIPPSVWGGVGFYMIIFMNAMKAIPKSIYEAAILEGANHYVRLFKITLPLIMGVVRVSMLFLMLGIFKGFEGILIMTNGGPSGSTDVIGLYMFNLAFGSGYHDYGYASAIGMFLFVVMIVANKAIDKFVPKHDLEF
ncbi:carbohydrate ABC transporter permease [Cohnella sp. GCM10020058]|uniref:carbohydrate ABC transporter permease n=1 Tax=Cohnella sp. GCM10020058 TaxID=3317330 RepID=UPI0036448495